MIMQKGLRRDKVVPLLSCKYGKQSTFFHFPFFIATDKEIPPTFPFQANHHFQQDHLNLCFQWVRISNFDIFYPVEMEEDGYVYKGRAVAVEVVLHERWAF